MMLEVKDLTVKFAVGKNELRAVDDISFDLAENEVVGLVGESGSGKSVTSLAMLNLIAANGKITKGQINWFGKDILQFNKEELRDLRGGKIGLIFQNPQASLNPVFTIGNQMIETIRLHQKVGREEAGRIAIESLKKVNIPDAEERLHHYPHQFSQGMCQRVMIALTLCMKPKLLIADEPTASLDVTIQAQILELLDELRQEYQMSVLLISHDLGIIAQRCDKVIIMYLGRIVEKGNPIEIFKRPLHPYTEALIASIPKADPEHRQKSAPLTGDVPSPMKLPLGCHFHPRCPEAFERCRQETPELKKCNNSEVACFLR